MYGLTRAHVCHGAGKLPPEGVAAVLEYVVASGYGEWGDAAHTRLKVFYKPPKEWAAMIHEWVTTNGLTGNVYTLYELHSGDVSSGQGQFIRGRLSPCLRVSVSLSTSLE